MGYYRLLVNNRKFNWAIINWIRYGTFLYTIERYFTGFTSIRYFENSLMAVKLYFSENFVKIYL